jgi:SEC-C motif-containing protein
MRSRYSAFAIGDAPYLRKTWHPSTRPATLELDADQHWYRLDIIARTRGGMLDSDGTVEFRAHFRDENGGGEQHEVSRFVRQGRRWFYLDTA